MTLESVKETSLLTRTRVVHVSAIEADTALAACLQERGNFPAGPAALRVSAHGKSVTFGDFTSRGVYACDGSEGRTTDEGAWCGRAFGRLAHGRLRDPRLDLGCTTPSGAPLAFAWVEPVSEAAYVTVRQRGFAETYEAASGLPVRIATITDIELDNSSARFRVLEHARSGTLLREYTLESRVAG